MDVLGIRQKYFINSLIYDGNLSINEINSRIESLNLFNIKAPLRVAAIQFNLSLVDHKEKDALLSEIEMATNVFLDSKQLFPVTTIDGKTRLIVIFRAKDNFKKAFIELNKKISEKYSIKGFIGIGSEISKLSDIHLSASDAINMLSYRYQYKSEGLIIVDDIVNKFYRSKNSLNTPYENVIDSFYAGDISKMEKALNTIVEEIRYTPNVSKSSIRRAMIELTVEILNIATNNNVDTEKYLYGIDPYTWILNQNHTEIIIEWFIKLCSNLITEMIGASKIDNPIIERVIDYIDSNLYRNELNLNLIASEIGLSKSYLSRYFKEKTGCGINEYIVNVRIAKSKKMLEKTDLKIKNISSQLGFSSISYFSKCFTKSVGVSPSLYRIQHNI